MSDLDAFTRAYVECALWSSTDNADESGGEPLDSNYCVEDVADATIARMIRDCSDFQQAQADLLAFAGDAAQNGHDFWLTRNGHGAGFWDRGYGPKGETLSAMCRAYGSVDLYVGDDGKVHAS